MLQLKFYPPPSNILGGTEIQRGRVREALGCLPPKRLLDLESPALETPKESVYSPYAVLETPKECTYSEKPRVSILGTIPQRELFQDDQYEDTQILKLCYYIIEPLKLLTGYYYL